MMGSSVPLAMPTPPPGGHNSPSGLSDQPPSNPLPAQAELSKQLDAEPSVMAVSDVAADESSATTTQSATEKADLQPWR